MRAAVASGGGFVAIGDEHARVRRGKRFGDSGADARPRTGYQGDFVVRSNIVARFEVMVPSAGVKPHSVTWPRDAFRGSPFACCLCEQRIAKANGW